MTAAFWNQQVRDNEAYLHGDVAATYGAGPFILPGNVTVQGILSHGVATQTRAHRHPYGNDRHIESGASAGGFSASFVDPYAAAANVAIGVTNANDSAWFKLGFNGAPGTTGFSMINYDNPGGGYAVRWIAEGVD